MTFRIVAAAIRCNGLTFTMPRPARHFNIMAAMPSKIASRVKPSEQGFLTDDGQFVGREEAKAIASAAGQLLNETPHAELFSEDLW